MKSENVSLPFSFDLIIVTQFVLLFYVHVMHDSGTTTGVVDVAAGVGEAVVVVEAVVEVVREGVALVIVHKREAVAVLEAAAGEGTAVVAAVMVEEASEVVVDGMISEVEISKTISRAVTSERYVGTRLR